MGLTAANELIIREALATTVSGIANAGFVLPAALYCNNVSDFWATLDGSGTNTKDEIDENVVAGCWIYPLNFVDDFSIGAPDSPGIFLTYEFYLFRQYGLMRADETATPDVFDKQMLLNHNKFVSAWLDIKSAFQGIRAIAGLPNGVFADASTTSLVQSENIQNLARCEFIPGIVGFEVRLQETVNLLLTVC